VVTSTFDDRGQLYTHVPQSRSRENCDRNRKPTRCPETRPQADTRALPKGQRHDDRVRSAVDRSRCRAVNPAECNLVQPMATAAGFVLQRDKRGDTKSRQLSAGFENRPACLLPGQRCVAQNMPGLLAATAPQRTVGGAAVAVTGLSTGSACTR
jgi:hypothetical protein